MKEIYPNEKEIYLDIMEKVVGAYSNEHIREYLQSVKEKGLSEHGFPRLTANIGILLAHGRRSDLREHFEEMMDICCFQIPHAFQKNKNVGNDFSVKEIVLAILEIEEHAVFSKEKTAQWRICMADINPYDCYNIIAKTRGQRVGNWAAYNLASEQLRKFAEIGDEQEFIDWQMDSQLPYFDENGLYCEPGQPTLYDLTTRLQMDAAMHFGYSGEKREKLDKLLKKGGLTTLYMQSVLGEIPFGGRSNQFVFNEAILAAVCEYEASRHARLGDAKTAGQFKSAAALAVKVLMSYLAGSEMYHIKNKYPEDSRFGCEGYGYFNKYMVTAASFIYLAYIFADNSIECVPCPAEEGGYVHISSELFHKVFANNGIYSVQYDTNADIGYDANGIGRIHRANAPAAICVSVPFSHKPKYNIDIENPSLMSLCCGYNNEAGVLSYTCETGTMFSLLKYEVRENKDILLLWEYTLNNGAILMENCEIKQDGVHLTANADGEVQYLLPVFYFDGKNTAEINEDASSVSVLYEGWKCTYRVNGVLKNTGLIYANRNGHYRQYRASGVGEIKVHIQINKQ